MKDPQALEAERDELNRQIDELRSFEREYRTRLISHLEDCLETAVAKGSGPALQSAVRRIATAGDDDLREALALLGPEGRQRLIAALLRHPVEETPA